MRITNQNSNKALSVVNGSVVQATFTNRAAQKWAMTSLGNVGGSKVAFSYRSLSTGHCLDIEGPGSGRAIVLRPCSTTKLSQHWVRDFAQNTTFLATVNRSSGLAMSVKNRSSSPARRSCRSSTAVAPTRSGASSASAARGRGRYRNETQARGVPMGGRQKTPPNGDIE